MSMISEIVEELIDNADLHTKELHDLMYRAADTIMMLSEKARELKQEWIPCSERLPEEDGTYLVAYTWKGDYSGMIYNEVLLMDFEHGKWESREKILAWMPLPEPWEGADDERL